MREFKAAQMKLGEVDISAIKIDLKSRDELPRILIGLQHIYTNKDRRDEIMHILKKSLPPVKTDTGRPGMDLWKILVLGVVRLGCNIDYDKLCDLSNQHKTLRMFLFHSIWDEKEYHLNTIRDNVKLLTIETITKINEVVVKSGHDLLKKKDHEELVLYGRCDSFVVETDVHYPTDINLLYDAIRKIINSFSVKKNIVSGWRQSEYWLREMKNTMREIEKIKNSIRGMEARLLKIPKSEKKKNDRAKKNLEKKKNELKKIHREYTNMAQSIIEKATGTPMEIAKPAKPEDAPITPDSFIDHAKRQIDLIRRRVLNNEKIPHHEKVFSIFEPHTEWVSKGKAGVPQELGVKVSIIEDQYQFILHHEVMFKTEDVDIAVPIVKKTKEIFPNFKSCSFDKGFHSPSNQLELKLIIDEVILPRKGRPAPEEKDDNFKKKRNQHSAVESAINCLEHHGLDMCRDHGKDGFERYVAIAVLSRNIDRLGSIIKKNRQDSISLKMAA